MSALDGNINNPTGGAQLFDGDAAAAVHVYHGALVSRDSSGNFRPARATNTDRVIGIADREVDNSAGLAGDLTVHCVKRVGFFVNSASSDEITAADVGNSCYVVDDQTVAKTSNAGARPIAGKILGLEGLKVRVDVGGPDATDGDLVAANNLSDVAAAATARANIGANKGHIFLRGIPLDADGVVRVALPACTLTALASAVEGATLTTSGVTITAAIAGTPVTNGVLTIAVGAVVGELDTAAPSAANVATLNQILTLTVAHGTQDAAATASVRVDFTY